MNSDQILDALEEIAATSKASEKAGLLERFSAFQAQEVLAWALNPFRRFYMQQIPEAQPGEGVFNEGTFTLLASLADRQITGHAAQAAVREELARLSAKSQELFRRVMTKDLRCGVSVKTALKVFPGLVPTFGCQLASPFETKHVKRWPVMVQPKLDGCRVLAQVRGGEVTFFSRNGIPFTSFDSLAEHVLAFANGDNVVFDGEVLSGSFLETVSSVRRKNVDAQDAVLHVFDEIPATLFMRYEEYHAPARDRFERLSARRGNERVRVVETSLEHTVEACLERYAAFRLAGYEGAIVKDPAASYVKKRSKAWLKMKPAETADLRIIGAVEGEGKYVGMLGALIVDFNGVEARVGTGFSDPQRRELWDAYLADSEGFSEPQLLGRITEVEFHETTPDGSLRHARFIRFRDSLTGEKE